MCLCQSSQKHNDDDSLFFPIRARTRLITRVQTVDTSTPAQGPHRTRSINIILINIFLLKIHYINNKLKISKLTYFDINWGLIPTHHIQYITI